MVSFLLFLANHLATTDSFNSSDSRELLVPGWSEHQRAATEGNQEQMEGQASEQAGSDIQTRASVARWGHPLCYWGEFHW